MFSAGCKPPIDPEPISCIYQKIKIEIRRRNYEIMSFMKLVAVTLIIMKYNCAKFFEYFLFNMLGFCKLLQTKSRKYA